MERNCEAGYPIFTISAVCGVVSVFSVSVFARSGFERSSPRRASSAWRV